MNNQIKNCTSPSDKQSLQALLRRVMSKLRNIRKGEHNRKKRWKIKNANKSFFQNTYQAGKNILDPKCNIKLTVDKHKASSVADPLHNIPLPPLKDLPEQPNILKGFNTSKFNFSDFMRFVNYHSLCTSIKANGWRVSFFAVEVGARGYAAESLLSCLRCLGFPSKLCRSTIKNILTTCLKCSFDIWMARNCSSWKLEGPCKSPSDVSSGPATTSASSQSIHLSTSKTASFPPETRKVDHPKTVKASQNKVNVNHFHCGLFNKGNTCYVNVILQALRPLSSLWSDSSTPSQTSSALGLAFRRLMANMGCAKTCINPSPFFVYP